MVPEYARAYRSVLRELRKSVSTITFALHNSYVG